MNKLINDKQIKINEKRKLKASSSGGTNLAGMSSASQFSLDKSILDPSRLFTLSTSEIERELHKIHSGILSSNYLLGTAPSGGVGSSTADYAEQPEGTPSQVIVLNSMSNTSPYEWRQAEYVEETKYIKEPLAYRNPFKLMIRPRNQVLQLNEIEDEAYLTNDEKKKKSTKLASYAIVYKQQVSSMVKKYGQWYRDSKQNGSEIEDKMKTWIKKHAEDKQNAKAKEAEIKRRLELHDFRRAQAEIQGANGNDMILEATGASDSDEGRNITPNQESLYSSQGASAGDRSRKQSQEFTGSVSASQNKLSISLAPAQQLAGNVVQTQFGTFCTLFDDLFAGKATLEKNIVSGATVGEEPATNAAVQGFLKDLHHKYRGVLGDHRNLPLQKAAEVLGLHSDHQKLL